MPLTNRARGNSSDARVRDAHFLDKSGPTLSLEVIGNSPGAGGELDGDGHSRTFAGELARIRKPPRTVGDENRAPHLLGCLSIKKVHPSLIGLRRTLPPDRSKHPIPVLATIEIVPVRSEPTLLMRPYLQ